MIAQQPYLKKEVQGSSPDDAPSIDMLLLLFPLLKVMTYHKHRHKHTLHVDACFGKTCLPLACVKLPVKSYIPVTASSSLQLSRSQACQIRQPAVRTSALPEVSCQSRPDTLHSLTSMHSSLMGWLALVIVCCRYSCCSCVDAFGDGGCGSSCGSGGGGCKGWRIGPACALPAVHRTGQTPALRYSLSASPDVTSFSVKIAGRSQPVAH